MPKYKFIADPGHGWLRVPLGELQAFGLLEKISACSYLDNSNGFAYLEEDCDLGHYCIARAAIAGFKEESAHDWSHKFFKDQVTDTHLNSDSVIRQLPRYSTQRARLVLALNGQTNTV
jgi:hypothetical protein